MTLIAVGCAGGWRMDRRGFPAIAALTKFPHFFDGRDDAAFDDHGPLDGLATRHGTHSNTGALR